ncbi:MAG: GGDEF domain-containing protein [Acidihalobacter sp.]
MEPSYEQDREYIVAKRRFLNVAVWLGVAAALLSAFVQFRDAEYVVAAQSLCFPLLGPFVLLYLRRSDVAYRRGLTLLALLTLLGQSLTTLFGLTNVVDLCWYAVYPLAYFFLLGPSRGLKWSFVGLCLTIALYWVLPWVEGYRPIGPMAFSMAMLAYGVAVMLAWFHVHMVAAYQRQLYERVNYDYLTGALSRVGGIDLLQRYVNLANRDPQQTLAVVSFDLDDFKYVNDVYGHDSGDRVLRGVAKALAAVIRRSDCLARWGGEEFLVLLPGTTLGDARGVADKLRGVVRTATRDMLPIPVTASIGVTAYQRGESIAELLKRVDNLMYAAKRSGKDAVVHGHDAAAVDVSVESVACDAQA